MTLRQTIPILLLVVAATTVRAQMTVTQSTTAPTNNLMYSQTSGGNSSPWRMQGGLRAIGQTFPGGFVLDKITIKMNTLTASGLEGDSFKMYIYTHTNATTPTVTSTVATVTGNLPAALKSDFDGGKVYLTFDLTTNLTLTAGQQYSFYLDPTGFSTEANFLVDSQASSGFTGGIGLQHGGPAELTVWTGANTPADLRFYLQAEPMITSLSAAEPAGNVVISQTNANSNVQFLWQQPLGTDNNPRDAGQSFLVGAGGLVLDKITVNIPILSTNLYDSQTVRLDIFTLDNASDFTPNSTVVSAVGNFPSNMKASFDSGNRYLTFNIPDVTLSGGQYYGFLLKHDAQKALNSNMRLSVNTSNGYTNGIGIVQQNRSTYYSSSDLQFYLQEAPLIDTTKPSMTGKNPVDNATDVLWAINLVATFDETVQAGTGNITLKKTAGDVLVESFDVTSSGRLTWGGAQVSIDPTNPLEGGVEYYVLIDATAIKDVAGNFFDGISSTTAWSFTTDGTPPTIQTLSPTNGAVNALLWANLVATFNETIVAGTGNIVITNLTDGTAMTIPVGDAQVTINGATLTFNPSSDLSLAKHYAVLIDAGAVKDASGNAFAGISAPATWGFTTFNLVTLPIVNPSAEANFGAAPTGWTVLTGTPTAQTAASRPIVADDGLNLFVFYQNAIGQTLGSTYQNGSTYVMSVDAAKRADLVAGQTTGWGFGLYYDNGGTLTEVAKTQGDATWANGTWLQKDLVLTVNPGAAYIGKAIVLKLFGASTSETSDFLDNVRLWGPKPPPAGTMIRFY